jgi:hypothetical protein
MAELDDLPALARKIEPLPGGLGELRQRLRESRRFGAPLALAAAVASAAIAMCMLRGGPASPPDRSAMQRLLVDAEQLPNPRAARLGLVPRAEPVVSSDPRVADSDTVVFYWVPPASAPE